MKNQQLVDLTQELLFFELLNETLQLSQSSRWCNKDKDPLESHVLP